MSVIYSFHMSVIKRSYFILCFRIFHFSQYSVVLHYHTTIHIIVWWKWIIKTLYLDTDPCQIRLLFTFTFLTHWRLKIEVCYGDTNIVRISLLESRKTYLRQRYWFWRSNKLYLLWKSALMKLPKVFFILYMALIIFCPNATNLPSAFFCRMLWFVSGLQTFVH